MFKPVAGFLTLSLFLWILPLGTFIKPSQERAACGGKRAFHQCSMMSGQARTEQGAIKVGLSSASGVQKGNSQNSSGDDLLIEAVAVPRRDPSNSFLSQTNLLQSFLFDLSLGQPPKNVLS